MEKVQAILFDLDGTLWDSSEGVLKSWNQVLEMHPECGRGPITQEELNGCFGLPMTEIAAKLFPGAKAYPQSALRLTAPSAEGVFGGCLQACP